jgi:hypothetical protein
VSDPPVVVPEPRCACTHRVSEHNIAGRCKASYMVSRFLRVICICQKIQSGPGLAGQAGPDVAANESSLTRRTESNL